MQTHILRFYGQSLLILGEKDTPEWVKNQLEAREIELKNILRWEDDGSQIVEVFGQNISVSSTISG